MFIRIGGVMKIYNVICDDRHCEPTVETYRDKDVALARCLEISNEYCRHKEDWEQNDYDGFLVHYTYSCEGCSTWVVEGELK
jgi:hypothetical protein